MYCQHCGAEISSNVKYCDICGKKVELEEEKISAYMPPSLGDEIKQKKFLFVIPFIHMAWILINQFVLSPFIQSSVLTGDTFPEMILSWIGHIIYGALLGGFVYTVINQTDKFSWLYMAPYLWLSIVIPLLKSTPSPFANIWLSLRYLTALLYPIAVFYLLKSIKPLVSKSKKHRKIAIFLSIVTTILCSTINATLSQIFLFAFHQPIAEVTSTIFNHFGFLSFFLQSLYSRYMVYLSLCAVIIILNRFYKKEA